jgi:hypothetical protein
MNGATVRATWHRGEHQLRSSKDACRRIASDRRWAIPIHGSWNGYRPRKSFLKGGPTTVLDHLHLPAQPIAATAPTDVARITLFQW